MEETTLVKDDMELFAQLSEKKKELENELNAVKDELDGLSEKLVEQFIDQEVAKVSLKGGTTLRLDCKIWPKISFGKTQADAVAAIKAAGLPELLARESFQTNSLAAFLRELHRNGDKLPSEFEGVIEPNPVYKIIATKR